MFPLMSTGHRPGGESSDVRGGGGRGVWEEEGWVVGEQRGGMCVCACTYACISRPLRLLGNLTLVQLVVK